MSDSKPPPDPQSSHLDSAWDEPTYTDEVPFGRRHLPSNPQEQEGHDLPNPPISSAEGRLRVTEPILQDHAATAPSTPEHLAFEPSNLSLSAHQPAPSKRNEPDRHSVSLGEHLRRPIALAGFSIPSWLLSAASVFLTATMAGLLAAMATSFLVGKTDGEVPASSPFRTGSLATDVPLLDLAAAGDPESMMKLEAKKPEDLTVNEIVALASGRAVQNKTALGTLSDELRQNPALQNDAEVMKRLREAFEDPELAREALHTIALLPDSKSADLLYEVWVGTRERTPTTQLAQALVYTKEVRGKASPSLLVALDLRRASSCEEVKPIVSRAVQHADRRSLRLLGMLTVRKGCGPQKLEDCYECLRDDEVLEEAIKVARSRMEPKL